MADKKGQKKRFWAVDEKQSICAQALAPGVSVAQVARRYSMNANLIFKWLKDRRFSPAADKTQMALEGDSIFLPVVDVSAPSIDHDAGDASLRTAGSTSATLLAHRVDITLSDGRYGQKLVTLDRAAS